MAVSLTPHVKYRLSVAARAVVAVGGGYLFVSLLTIAAALLLPRFGINQAQTMLAMSMASFVVYAVIIMAVFHARSIMRAVVALAIACLPFIITIVLLSLKGQG
jgi:hypothetical protein